MLRMISERRLLENVSAIAAYWTPSRSLLKKPLRASFREKRGIDCSQKVNKYDVFSERHCPIGRPGGLNQQAPSARRYFPLGNWLLGVPGIFGDEDMRPDLASPTVMLLISSVWPRAWS